MNNPIEILPPELQKKSLSNSEIVLPFSDALLAIDVFEKSGWAFLGWEGWLRYPTGQKSHSQRYQGTASLERQDNERWGNYVRRTASVCRETIIENESKFMAHPKFPGVELFFCLTVTKD